MAAPDASTIAAVPIPLFRFTDRSRYETRKGRCERQAYLQYDLFGGGISPIGESLPLATGGALHEAAATLLTIMQALHRLPTDSEVRVSALYATERYIAKVEAGGFRGVLAGPTTDETIAEQAALVEGMTWAFAIKVLPWLHATYKILKVEEPHIHILSCTCGAGPLPALAHIERGCQGHALNQRIDCLAAHRTGSGLAYFEIKTTGWDSDAWAEQWETKPQLALGTLDVFAEYGKEVTELFIIAINKGSRRKDERLERKVQQSPLCYGYVRPGNPPLMVDDWLPAYEWKDAEGATKRATRAHQRRGVWTLPTTDWAAWTAYHEQDPAMTPVEFWVKQLPASLLDRICFVLGPMNRQDTQLQSLRRSMQADEARWEEVVTALSVEMQEHGWSSDEFQSALDFLVPQSWNCRPFGREHQCAYVPICFKGSGWQDPLGSGHFARRMPHHEAETIQLGAKGLLPTVSVAGDDE